MNTSLSFTLEEEAVEPLAIAGFSLLSDSGASSIDDITANPTVVGQVTGDGTLVGLLIEFDHDSDGVADGSATTDMLGEFTYAPAGLSVGSVTVSARARELDNSTNTYLIGSWTSLTFTYQTDANVAAELESWGLWNDTGDSDTDNITIDATLTGTVSNDGPVGSLVVEFDHDDGFEDGSVVTDVTGALLYTPAELPDGRNTIRARAVHAGSGLSGDWTSVSFVLSDDPDSVQAQAQVAALDGFDAAMQAAETNYDASVATAGTTYDSAINTAATNYQGSITQAESDQTTADSAADATLASAVASADAAYTTAINTAAAAYATAMGAYAGDPTSYEEYGMVGGFSWPGAPDSTGGPRPAEPGPAMPADLGTVTN